ncbi:MAG: class I SAM-dependent methyltransferase [Paracoccaceae bacterium]
MAVTGLFDRIAPRYDLMNDLDEFPGTHRLWKRVVVAKAAELASGAPGIVVDLAGGTGDLPCPAPAPAGPQDRGGRRFRRHAGDRPVAGGAGLDYLHAPA